MDETVSHKKSSSFRVAFITAVLTLLITGGGAYFLGYLFPPFQKKETAFQKEERKIAYWRAPMNPTEIYDKPGKSAMGMDLVPVYEDELDDQQASKIAPGSDTGRKIAYWRAPMNPTEIYDKPGKSAMGMDLIPVYEDELIGGVEVKIDPVIQQNMGLRTAPVTEEPLIHTIRTYGHITPDETRTAQVSLKAGGWIETLYLDFKGMFVEKDQIMFDIYSPQLLAVQEELQAAKRRFTGKFGEMGNELMASARRRLRYFDIAESEIKQIEVSGVVQKTLPVRSPLSGYVIEKNVEEGSYVPQGKTLFRITDLTRVWVEAHIYEFELPWVKEGQQAEMSLSYLPGKVFLGRVAYVYPYLQRRTRDVVIRLEFDNPDLHLKPDMFADVRIKSMAEKEGIVIPSEAVIRSGQRNVVFVQREDDKFAPRDVTLGLSLDEGKIQILTGLAPGERVVTSGQFLLDSESKLKEAVQKMLDAKREKAKRKEPIQKEADFFKDMEKEEEEDFFEDMEQES